MIRVRRVQMAYVKAFMKAALYDGFHKSFDKSLKGGDGYGGFTGSGVV